MTRTIAIVVVMVAWFVGAAWAQEAHHVARCNGGPGDCVWVSDGKDGRDGRDGTNGTNGRDGVDATAPTCPAIPYGDLLYPGVDLTLATLFETRECGAYFVVALGRTAVVVDVRARRYQRVDDLPHAYTRVQSPTLSNPWRFFFTGPDRAWTHTWPIASLPWQPLP